MFGVAAVLRQGDPTHHLFTVGAVCAVARAGDGVVTWFWFLVWPAVFTGLVIAVVVATVIACVALAALGLARGMHIGRWQ